MQLLFSISLFLSAGLLFVIQPMVAKTLLPAFGGTPAVWTICMLFFQSLLLLGYGYAWFLSRLVNSWNWRVLHIFLVVLSLFSIPLLFSITPGQGIPELTILKSLVYQLGLPLLVIAASAPLLQFAYSHTTYKKANDPYFLYVASNVGSLLALLSYPWLIERFLGLNEQYYYWNIGYGIYIALLLTIFFGFTFRQLIKPTLQKTELSWPIIFRWIGYSFIPCSLMLGVTFYISTDVAAAPVFWILPLALYLLSFIITFAQHPLISSAWIKRNTLVFFIFPILSFILSGNFLPIWQIVIFHLLNFFMIALLCHGQLIENRPPVNQLTIFYFCLAIGGVLAGFFNSILAPRIFNDIYEYPFVLALALFCIPCSQSKTLNFVPLVVFILLIVNYFLPETGFLIGLKKRHIIEIAALFLIVIWPGSKANLFIGMSILLLFIFFPGLKKTTVLAQQRNFYGIKQVQAVAGSHALISQNTVHGFQLWGPQKQSNGALGYYAPAAQVVQLLQQKNTAIHSIILGLGTGMMVCEYRKADQITIIDIDEQVINIAKDPQLFTYLNDCPVQTTILKGDGRLELAKTPNGKASLLVIDAFSSDAIPIHLLTLEAFKLYMQKIIPDGAILAHISNRNLRLLPVLTAAGRQLDLIVLHTFQNEDVKLGQFASEWVLLTANQDLAGKLMRNPQWRFVAENDSYSWTDDYSNLIPLIKW